MARRARSSRAGTPGNDELPPRGIFMLADAKGPIEWQQPPALTKDLAQRIAFNCFICGVELSADRTAPNRATDEDVFAKWVQRRFNLRNEHFPLQNGSQKKYSDLLIPACGKCNNEYMSQVEDRIARALAGGFSQFSTLRREDVYLWLAKVYYGLVYHETKLSDWRNADASFTPLLPETILRDLAFLLDLLQGFHKRVLVGGPEKLFSLLMFPLHSGTDAKSYFRPALRLDFPCIALQLGSVGVFSVLDDFGTTENAYDQVFASALRGQTLHPIQFWEVVGHLSYLSSRMPFECSFAKIEGDADVTLDYAPRSSGDLPVDVRDEAEWVSALTGLPLETFFGENGLKSLVLRSDRTFNEVEFRDE